jgi:CspA family cold shock protein
LGTKTIKEKSKMRHRGEVKVFKGTYGWITPESGGSDVFVHFSAIKQASGFRQLFRGDRVEFELGENEKGPVAKNVKVIGREDAAA